MFEESPALNSYPRREGAFYLSTEAIDDRLEAVLEQDQVNAMGKTERKVVAVLCHQQGLWFAEMLAVIIVCEQFRCYFNTGSSIYFTLSTDHSSLTWLCRFTSKSFTGWGYCMTMRTG